MSTVSPVRPLPVPPANSLSSDSAEHNPNFTTRVADGLSSDSAEHNPNFTGPVAPPPAPTATPAR